MATYASVPTMTAPAMAASAHFEPKDARASVDGRYGVGRAARGGGCGG
ncbi:MAG TPA: hypothetical protein VHZ53_02285 [Steroidobacteraceae bacterium]|nr:hypothetical protein [Steroidobacteraceae bacterium]